MGNYIVKFCSCQEKNEVTNTTTEFRIGKNNQQDTLKDEFKTNICESKLTPTEKLYERSKKGASIDTNINNDFDSNKTDVYSDIKETALMEKRLSYSDKSEYTGTILKGQRHGKGIFRGENGVIYDGEWKFDTYEGQGKLISEDGSVYIGSFVNGKKHGKGRNQRGNSIYEGEFKENFKFGKGKETYSNGSVYEGFFNQGKKCGNGTYLLPDGSYYEGQFFNDNINGLGTFKWNENKTYMGEWKDNSLHGYGTLIKSGKKYQGYFENNQKHGNGIYIINNENKKIVGNFIENRMEGLAIQYNGEEIHHLLLMENNKIKKQLNKEEAELYKKSEDYMKLIIFMDEANLRSGSN